MNNNLKDKSDEKREEMVSNLIKQMNNLNLNNECNSEPDQLN